MTREKYSGFRHLIYAMRWSWAGLCSSVRDESAFRQELVLFFILAPLAFGLGETPIERIVLVASLLWVLIAELLNTAVEAAVNRIGKEEHPLSGKAKDAGSAAVMLAILNVLMVWGIMIYSRILS